MALSKNSTNILSVFTEKDILISQWDIAKETRGKRNHRDYYPRVHESIRQLETYGFVKVYKETPSARGMPKKLYGLTFQGVLRYLSSFVPKTQHTVGATNSYQIKLSSGEIENIARLLETYGGLLEYPIFKEIRWLQEHFEQDLFQTILYAAKSVMHTYPATSFLHQIMVKSKDPKFLEDIRDANSSLLRQRFALDFAGRLTLLKGKGGLSNDQLFRFFSKVEQEIELENKSKVESMKRVTETFRV